jgi:hypothetical protein
MVDALGLCQVDAGDVTRTEEDAALSVATARPDRNLRQHLGIQRTMERSFLPRLCG